MRINVTLDRGQKITPAMIDAFMDELSKLVLPV